MNIILYGIPAAIAEKIAGHYGLGVINSLEDLGSSGSLLLVPKITAPRQLLAFYNAMRRHEDDIDAVIVCGTETCGAAGTIHYGSHPGKLFTLGGNSDDEEIETELYRLIDAILAQANQLNL